MAPPISVNIISNKANTYGLNDDVTVIERILKGIQDKFSQTINKPKTTDMREPLIHCDVQIHLEIPVFSAIPWAHTNIMLVNPEQWSYSYDAYVHAFDALIFRDSFSAEVFKNDFTKKGIRTDNIFVVPWCNSWSPSDYKERYEVTKDSGFICFVAGSSSKLEYVKSILPFWKEDDPSLTIYTTREDFADELMKVTKSKNITVKCEDLSVEARRRLMALHTGHLVCSQGEAYGYAAANAETVGAFTIMNNLHVFNEYYNNSSGIYWLSNNYEVSTNVRYSLASHSNSIRDELDEAFNQYNNADFSEIRIRCHKLAVNRHTKTCDKFLPVFKNIIELVNKRRPTKGNFFCPPPLHQTECPPISIITPTYNRQKLIDIAFHNLLVTDYPKDKIEWVVIEDNEKTPHMAAEKIISFQIQVPDIKIKYIPIEGRMSIGEKRNHAIEHASNDIIVFMDDDDHYPETSLRRRVAWLTKGTKCGRSGEVTIACCTTLALYDLIRGVSAVNVPPYDIPFAQRISEATLTFKKSAWIERKFPNVSISEGEDWISGREDQVIEMPPQQIIVAFSHNSNQSSRRIPPSDQKPSCFWGFPKEYLVFIHGLVGVEIDDGTTKKNKTK